MEKYIIHLLYPVLIPISIFCAEYQDEYPITKLVNKSEPLHHLEARYQAKVTDFSPKNP